MLAFAIQIILARELGPHEFGVLISSIAISTMLALTISFGVPQFWLRIFGKNGWSANLYIPKTLAILAINIGATALALAIWLILSNQDKKSETILIVLFIHSLGLAAIEITSAKYQLEENYKAISLLQSIPAITRLCAVIALIIASQEKIDAIAASFAYAISATPPILLALLQIAKLAKGEIRLEGHEQNTLPPPSPLPNKTTMNVAQETLPLGVFGLLNFIYFQSDTILLSQLSSTDSAGQYGVAYSVIAAIYIIPTIFYQKYLLPKLHRWSHHDRDKLLRVISFGNKAMLSSGIAIFLIILSLADYCIPLVFGENYHHSATIIKALAICIPIQFLISSASASLLSHSHTKLKVYCLAIAAAMKISINILLIPSLATFGAVASTFASSLTLLILYYTISRKSLQAYAEDTTDQ